MVVRILFINNVSIGVSTYTCLSVHTDGSRVEHIMLA